MRVLCSIAQRENSSTDPKSFRWMRWCIPVFFEARRGRNASLDGERAARSGRRLPTRCTFPWILVDCS